MQNDGLPQQIGRLTLGEKRSDGERLCSHCHTVPAGHPLYWPERMGEYPDDMDPLCLAHAIEQAVDDNGWCDKCAVDEATTAALAEREAVDRKDVLVAIERNWNHGPDALADAILAKLQPAGTCAVPVEAGGLREAAEELDRYASHSIGCALYQQSWVSGEPKCSCGLDRVRDCLRARAGTGDAS